MVNLTSMGILGENILYIVNFLCTMEKSSEDVQNHLINKYYNIYHLGKSWHYNV